MKLLGLFLILSLTACSSGSSPGAVAGPASESPSPVTSTPASTTFIYRVGPGSDRIYYASVDLTTGSLSEHGARNLASADGPSAVAVSVDKKFLFVALGGSKKIVTYDLNQVSGEPTQQSTYGTITPSKKLLVDPVGRFLYSLEDEWVVAYTIGADGTLFWRGVTAISGGTSLAIDSLGKFLYVSGTSSGMRSYDINQTTGVLSNPGSLFGTISNAMKVNPATSRLYGSRYGTSDFLNYELNPATGAMTFTTYQTTPRTYPYYDIEFNAAGTHLYAVNNFEGTLESFTAASAPGALTRLNYSTLPAGCLPVSLELSSDGNFAFTGCTNSSGKTLVFKVEADGTITALASSIVTNLKVESITTVTF